MPGALRKGLQIRFAGLYLVLLRQAGFESSKGGLRLMPQPAAYGFVVHESILPSLWISNRYI